MTTDILTTEQGLILAIEQLQAEISGKPVALPPLESTGERDVWLRERETYIGATDLSAILGLNPYSTPLSVYCSKLRIVEPEPETHAMKRGIILEPAIARFYENQTGRTVRKWERVVRHPDKPHLGVNPDYYVPDVPTSCDQDELRLVECKSHLPFVAHHYGEVGTDQVPEWEQVQAQWQCHLTGITRCDVAVLLGLGEDDFRIYPVTYDPEIGAMLEEAADAFWTNHIVAQVPPAVTGSTADTSLLKKLYPKGGEPPKVADEEINIVAITLREIKEQMKSLEEDEKRAENILRSYMGDAEELILASGAQYTLRPVAECYVEGFTRKAFRALRFKKGKSS